jgi:hypothetical protein
MIWIITARSPQHQKAITALSLCSGGINHIEHRGVSPAPEAFRTTSTPFRPGGLMWRPLSGQILMPNFIWLAVTAL